MSKPVDTEWARAVDISVVGERWFTQTTQPDTDNNSSLPATGTDPGHTTRKLDDVVVAANSNEGQFLLKPVSPATYQSAWGKVDRTDNRGEGNTISLTAYRRTDPKGPATQRAVEPDVGGLANQIGVRHC